MASNKDLVLQNVSIPRYFKEIIEPNEGSYYDKYPVNFDWKPTVCCPLHEEDTPSFRLYENDNEPQSFYCFGCQRGGNVINLHIYYMEQQTGKKPTFFEAVDFLYKRFIEGREVEAVKIKPISRASIDKRQLIMLKRQKDQLEGSINADSSINMDKKKKLWRELDILDIELFTDNIGTEEAKQRLYKIRGEITT